MEVTRAAEARIVDDIVSKATRRNWARLGVGADKRRCATRANKRLSDRHIMPKESFDDQKNVQYIEHLAQYAQDNGLTINELVFSVGLELMRRANVTQENIDFIVSKYSDKIRERDIRECYLPHETNILSLIYQYMQTEGEKNAKGSYYTPKDVVMDMVKDIELLPEDKVLDPCCGGGVFLLNVPNIKPEQIYGVDLDPIAVMISQINFFLKFPVTHVRPKIFCANFLEQADLFLRHSAEYQQTILDNSFDYIITNPPWGGANNDYRCNVVTSGETFSYFLVKSYSKLCDNGVMRFLLPDAILNVKTHQDIRKYLLESTNLSRIKSYQGTFTGVMTRYVALETKKSPISTAIVLEGDKENSTLDKSTLTSKNYYSINFITSKGARILNKIKDKKTHDLSKAVWALGIVTGDNKHKLFDEMRDGLEPIYTGKEIIPYKLKAAKKYILYDRTSFQQVAKDEIYRAPEKLAYKFISNKLTFSIDTSGQLFLNSANLLIPNIPSMSINTVAAFLNSELYQFFYQKSFGGIKVLKSNLLLLPFMSLTKEQDAYMSGLVNDLIDGKQNKNIELQQYIYGLFNITNEEVLYIKGELYGNT